MKKPVIYKIRNVANNKFYVGSTTNTRERFRTHRIRLRNNKHHCLHLQASWNKYGEDCFKFEVVEEVESEDLLWAAEDRWLDEHFGKPYCYNAGRSADAPMRGRYGELHPNFQRDWGQDFKDKISDTLKEFYAADPANHPRLGKRHTEETKAKISASKKANPVAYWEGKQRSEATKAKISAAQKGREGRKFTEAEREAIRQRTLGNKNFLGKTHTEEAKQKMRKPMYAILPDGTRRDFVGVSAAGEELGVAYPMILRACKAGKPIAKGKLKGWQFFYA